MSVLWFPKYNNINSNTNNKRKKERKSTNKKYFGFVMINLGNTREKSVHTDTLGIDYDAYRVIKRKS